MAIFLEQSFIIHNEKLTTHFLEINIFMSAFYPPKVSIAVLKNTASPSVLCFALFPAASNAAVK